jgi:hypothetical protein
MKLPSFMVTRLYTSACVVLRHIDRMDNSGSIKLSGATFFFFYATTLASFTILRLLKASTAQYMDENAKEAFFLGVNVMKRLSIETNDGPSRMAQMLTQLWNSEKAFKNADGSEHTVLRIRTRLAMSPVFDSIWWWREEFGGQRGAYTDGEGAPIILGQEPGLCSRDQFKHSWLIIKGPTITEDPNAKSDVLEFQGITPIAAQEVSHFLDDQLLAELGWTTQGNNFMYPAVPGPSPYAPEWYSSTDVNGFAI